MTMMLEQNHNNPTNVDDATTAPAPAAAAVYQRRHHSNNIHHSNIIGSTGSNSTTSAANISRKDKIVATGSNNNNNNNHILLFPKALFLSLITSVSSSFSSSSSSATANLNTNSTSEQQQQQQKFIRRTTLSIVSLCILYVYVLFRTQHILDKHEAHFHGRKQNPQRSNTNHNNQLRRGQPVRMIPLSPIEMVKHPDTIQQLARNFPHEQQHRHGDELHDNNRILSSHASREPRQYLQYLQSQALQTKHANGSTGTSISSSTTSTPTITDTDLFLVYNANIGGQGVGNLIAGLLSAHLLGDEFHRIVCVNPIYWNSGFLDMFEVIDPVAKLKCPLLFHQQQVDSPGFGDISLINYEGAADECALQNLMLNVEKKVIYLVANTYPRWPLVPNNYFLYFYRPTSALFEALPYTIQPTTVVHLRQPDDFFDKRDGLDGDSLEALGKLLPSNSSTFLVTNNVKFYHRFTKCCQWSHPNWKAVQHSALALLWGASSRGDAKVVESEQVKRETNDTTAPPQHIQLWVDWYTLLMADDVYHTHSDFSISAIHWMNKKNHSFTIRGYNGQTQQLDTAADLTWEDGETIPVRKRTLKGQPGTTNELRACSPETRRVVEERERRNSNSDSG